VTSHFRTAIFDQVASKPIVPKAAAWKAAALATELAIAMLASLGQSGRFARLEPVIRRSFDITTMARLSVGSSWATLSEAQRHQVVESFGRYISAIYIAALK
jgi:ABC-type transporter MlaC component